MTTVTWEEKLSAIGDKKPVAKGGNAGVYWADYRLADGYWRYTWTNFTLDDLPTHVDVYKLEEAF